MMAKGHSKTVWASPDLWDELDARAEVEGLNRNALVRRILEDYLSGRLVRDGGGPSGLHHGPGSGDITERLDALQLSLDLLADPATDPVPGTGAVDTASGLQLLPTRQMTFFLLSRLLFIAAFDFVRIGDALKDDPALNDRVRSLAEQFLQSMAPSPPAELRATDPLA